VFGYGPQDGGFAVCTGPNPWGCGSWGSFPVSAIISVRPLRADDAWPISGDPSRKWTPEDLLSALRRHDRYTGFPKQRTADLADAIARARVEAAA